MLLIACLAKIYGASSILLLGLAWLDPAKNQSEAMRRLVTGVLASIVVGSLDLGMISGLEWGLTSVLGAVLWGQRYFLHHVVERVMAEEVFQPMR